MQKTSVGSKRGPQQIDIRGGVRVLAGIGPKQDSPLRMVLLQQRDNHLDDFIQGIYMLRHIHPSNTLWDPFLSI